MHVTIANTVDRRVFPLTLMSSKPVRVLTEQTQDNERSDELFLTLGVFFSFYDVLGWQVLWICNEYPRPNCD